MSGGIPTKPTHRYMDEAVLQISGAEHWFLEGLIGDHSVDFLVDSGSAVTALSCSFYQTLVRAGAPVAALRTTPIKLNKRYTIREPWVTKGILV